MTSTAVASYEPSPPEAAPRPGAPDALPVFSSDGAQADDLGRAAPAALLAELALHRRADTPLSIGVFGPPGSGKSRFLSAVVDAAARLAAAAGAETNASPFLSRVVAARIEAVPGRGAAGLLVGGVLDALAAGHASFAEDAVHAGGDPREAARIAGDRVDALRRSLDGERQSLDELSGRRARLSEAVLFEGAGSRLDVFARANRGRVEARLRAFGLPSSDPIRGFKDVVRGAAEPGGGGSQAALTLRAFYAFKGQGTLVVLAVLLAALGAAAGAGADRPADVANWLAGLGDRFSAATDAARAHLDLLQPISSIAFALCALAVLADIVRAARFLGPVYRGIALFKADLAARRRDLDGLLAHQTRRVDGLAAEVESAGRGAEAAQRRAEGRAGGLSDHSTALARELFGLGRTPETAAEGFFARLGEGLAAGGGTAPERVLVAVDGLHRLAAAEAASFLASAERLLGRPGFTLLLALERDATATALGESDPAGAGARLDRAVQVSYDLGATPPDATALAERLLDPRIVEDRPHRVDASRSALDRAFESVELDLVRRLAPLAGGTPRSVKRFVNAYRLARADPRLARAAPASLAMLAMSLALDGTGAGSEVSGFEADVAKGQVKVDQGSEFGRAFTLAIGAVGPEVGGADLRRGLAVARSYGRRG